MNTNAAYRDPRTDIVDFAEPSTDARAPRAKVLQGIPNWRTRDTRRHARAPVSLRANVIPDRSGAYSARTVDLSEGGVLLCGYDGPPLQRGRLVGVTIEGILSDREDDGDLLIMHVVRHDGDALALRFAD